MRLAAIGLPAQQFLVAYRLPSWFRFVEAMASQGPLSFYIRWSFRCPYPPTLRIHTHYHHRLFLRSLPAATILAHPSGLSAFRTPLKSCSSLYTL